MTSFKIGIMGDIYEIFSLAEPPESTALRACRAEKGRRGISLYPTASEAAAADFSLALQESSASSRASELSASVAAGAFLLFERGLPLDRVEFDINGKMYSVFNTGGGVLKIALPKSKEKITKIKLEPLGAEADCLLIGSCPQTLLFFADDLSHVSDSSLRSLIGTGDIILSTVMACSINGGSLNIRSCSEHFKGHADRLAIASLVLSSVFSAADVSALTIDGFCASLEFDGGSRCLSLSPKLLH